MASGATSLHWERSARRRGKPLGTYWFDLSSVQFPSVQHDGMDGITCPGSLDVCGEHIQEVLGKNDINSNKSTGQHADTYIFICIYIKNLNQSQLFCSFLARHRPSSLIGISLSQNHCETVMVLRCLDKVKGLMIKYRQWEVNKTLSDLRQNVACARIATSTAHKI